MKRTFLLLAMLLFVMPHGSAVAQVAIDTWLTTGPQDFTVTVEKELDGDAASRVLDTPPVDPIGFWPQNGTSIRLEPQATVTMKQGALTLPAGASELIAATYLDVPAWQHGTFTVTGDAPFRLWLEGDDLLKRESAGSSNDTLTADATLDQGKRRLLLVMTSEKSDAASSLSISWTKRMVTF